MDVESSGEQFIDYRLYTVVFSGVNFRKTTFSNVHMRNSRMSRSVFKNCKFTGFNFTRNLIEDVKFTDCKFELCSFNETFFKRVTFIKCVLQDVDFRASNFRLSGFSECNIDKVDIQHAKFTTNFDLSDSTLKQLNGISTARKLILDEDQLSEFATYWAAEKDFVIKGPNSPEEFN